MTRTFTIAVALGGTLFFSLPASAQPAPSEATGPKVPPSTSASVPAGAAPAAATGETSGEGPAVVEAREHHRRGLELFDEGDYKLALVEFERAYALVRSYKVLYNIGQVQLQLTHYAKARLALEQYLREGGEGIPEKRRADVERDLATLRTRTATLTIKLNVPDAEIAINDVIVGHGALEKSLVDAGPLRVVVSKAGYVSQRRELALAGGDDEVVTVNLSTTATPQTSGGLSEPAIISWIATGALATGAVVTGLVANGASSKYDRMRAAPAEGTADERLRELDKQRGLVRGLALTTDILAGAAVVGAGVSLYFTLKGKPQNEAAPQLKVQGTKATFSIGF